MAADNANSARPVTNPKLPDAIQDAQILLSFAAQSGLTLDPEVVKTIVETATLTGKGTLTDAQEAAFWTALNSLAKAISPVTISSLRATMDSHVSTKAKVFGIEIGRTSLARGAVRWYTGCALLTLFFLLLFQIYWLFGTSTTAEILTIKKDITDVDTKLQALTKAANTRATGQRARTSDPSAVNPDIKALEIRMENLELRKHSSYDLLKFWSAPWEGFTTILDSSAGTDDQPDPQKSLSVNIARFQAAVVVLEILQRYLLPLLYGLLGTCVYILRTLAQEIRSRTYSEASNIGFRIRLYLGTLGGIVFAWFVTPETADGLFKSLSPFALAFLSGYSVELWFAAMDRFLAAFTKKD